MIIILETGQWSKNLANVLFLSLSAVFFYLLQFSKNINRYCAVPENIHTPPTEGIEISWGCGGFCNTKILHMKLNWSFHIGGVLEKFPYMGEGMDIFWNNTLQL